MTGATIKSTVARDDGKTRDDGVLSGLRVLVVHEWLYTWAGAERCLEEILRIFPTADLLVGVMTPQMREYNHVTRRARESWVGLLPGARTRHRWFLPFHALAFALEDTSGYDLVISCSHAFEKFVRVRGATQHLCYCYSPPRFLWDMQATYGDRASPAGRAALRFGSGLFRAVDRNAASRVHRFVSISRHIADRVQRCYGAESAVVYPPVSPKPMPASGDVQRPHAGEYLLYLGRLVEYKRVDLLIQAAELLQMPLVVAGDGPERRSLERLAEGLRAGARVEFRPVVSESEAALLLAGCSAFAFAGEEDFGISLVEANAAGRPVVCYARGGAAETMVPDITATFFEDQSAAAIAAAVQRCLRTNWDRAALERNARRFAPERFRDEFRAAAAAVMSGVA